MTEQNELTPGRHQGRIVGIDSGPVGQNNTPVAKLFFEIDGIRKVVSWSGWFSEKVNQRTNKTYTQLVLEKLIECGFSGKCVSEMSDRSKRVEELFNTEKVWDLDIDYQTDKDGNVTQYFEVKWINDPDKPFTSKLDHGQAVQTFKGMNIGGELARLRQNNKTETENEQLPDGTAADDIPF